MTDQIERIIDMLCVLKTLPDDAPAEIREVWEFIHRPRLKALKREGIKPVT